MEQAIAQIVNDLFDTKVEVELTRPEAQFGDYASNIAMQLAKQVGQNPRQIAEMIAERLRGHEDIASVEIAGPGFINIWLSDSALLAQMHKVSAVL